MKNLYIYINTCLIICLTTVIRCTNISNVAGAGSETTNSLTGTVASIDGTPSANAIVKLIPASYDPVRDRPLDSTFTTVTNNRGVYEFKSIDTGSYNVFVMSRSGDSNALVFSVHATTDTVSVTKAVLTIPGAIRVNAPENVDKTVGYVYVPGSLLFAFFNACGKPVILGSAPSGTMPEIVYSTTNNSSLSQIIRSNVTVQSGDTSVAANNLWAHDKKITLNTSSTGAPITTDVYNFPVLIRLNQTTFDFSEAKTNGADLRFATPDNRFLPYEIERWDTISKYAEIWVNVDTVRGNNSNQFITMYWGNSGVSAISSGVSTFDTSKGFQAVWHFAGDGASTVYDATINGYNGTPYNMTAASSIDGAIGKAREFNGMSSYVTIPNSATGKLNFPENGTYTMSLWVYADTLDTIWHAIAGKGHEQYYMQLKGLGHNKATWEFVEFQNQRGWEYTEDSTPPSPGARQWLYLTGVRSSSNQSLYINGVKVKETVSLMKGLHDRNTSDDFCIGRFGHSVTIPRPQGWSWFDGIIDEVRVSNLALSDDWIKLCYMNQRVDDKLVIFKK